jgi:hypothetical protein
MLVFSRDRLFQGVLAEDGLKMALHYSLCAWGLIVWRCPHQNRTCDDWSYNSIPDNWGRRHRVTSLMLCENRVLDFLGCRP